MSSKEIENYNYNCIEDSKDSDSNIKYSENNISTKEKVINDKDNDFVLIDKKDDKDSLINENKQEENKNYEIDINSFETNLNDEEILKAKDNGFVLIGKTGVGKTSLLNLLYGSDIGKVGYSSQSETTETKYYCLKGKIGEDTFYFSIIDTPGLYDTNGKDIDKLQKKDILKTLFKEKIKIKSILFCTNFQNERFDASEQNTLIEYNSILPLKDFWSRIILIFTHYYGDPEGDSKEQIKDRSFDCLNEIINKMMEKVKDVSNPIKFKDMKKKYINIYSKHKNNKQIKNNQLIREDIISEIFKYRKLEPMYNKLECYQCENYKIHENDEFIYDFDYIKYLDFNDNIIFEKIIINNKYSTKKYNKKKQKIKVFTQNCEVNKEGELKINKNQYKSKAKLKKYFGYGLSAISIGASLIYFPYSIVCLPGVLGGIYMIKNNSEQKEEKIFEINENILVNEIKNEEKEKNNESNEWAIY